MTPTPKHQHCLAALCGLMLLLGGCFPENVSLRNQSRAPASVVAINKVTESGFSSGTFNPTSQSAQMLSVDDASEIAGAAVMFPPGALAISADITVQEGASIATPALAGSLSIASGFQSTGAPVAVTANQILDAAKPFTISLPLPATATNLSLSDLYENLVVTYVVTIAATGETRAGALPAASLRIENNKVAFETSYFGVFQAALTVEKIAEEIKAATSVLAVQTKIAQQAEQKNLLPMEVTGRSSLRVKEGEKITLLGKNFRSTIRLTLNDKSISSLSLASDSSLSFTAPSGLGLGLITLQVEQEETKQAVSLVVEKTGPHPLMSTDKSQVCNDMQFYDLSGVLHTGTRDCRTSLPDCVSDGEVGCKATSSFKSLNVASFSAADIKKDVTLAGVTGTFPNATNKLSGADATPDLVSSSFVTAMKSASSFEWYDSTGNRYTNTGDADIKAGLVRSGVDIFGTVGTVGSTSPFALNLTSSYDGSKITTNWARTGTGIILVRRTGASVTWVPSNGTSYVTGSVDGNHDIVYVGTALTYDDTSVSPNSLYKYKAYAYNSDYGYSVASNEASQTTVFCGGAGDSCYNDAGAMTAGAAETPSGKNIVYVTASGSFKVWKDATSNKVLRANGLDEWAMKLNLDGKGFQSAGNEFTDYTSLEGRKCPPNVYIDDANKVSANNCLYYTAAFADQALSAAGTSQTTASEIGLKEWNTYNGGDARWYVGNIKTCSDLGMRLPTMFETTTTATSESYYPTDATPIFALSNGIPSHASAHTWTASGASQSSGVYWLWLNGAKASGTYSGTNYVRCALP